MIGLLEPWFDAIGRGAINVPGIHPETARTTRRLVTILLWLWPLRWLIPMCRVVTHRR
jgi:hypothetical protein